MIVILDIMGVYRVSKYEKLIERLRARPYKKDIMYEEVVGLLEKFGFKKEKNGTSHSTFRNDFYPGHINLVKDRPLKSYSIDDICELLDFLENENEK